MRNLKRSYQNVVETLAFLTVVLISASFFIPFYKKKIRESLSLRNRKL